MSDNLKKGIGSDKSTRHIAELNNAFTKNKGKVGSRLENACGRAVHRPGPKKDR